VTLPSFSNHTCPFSHSLFSSSLFPFFALHFISFHFISFLSLALSFYLYKLTVWQSAIERKAEPVGWLARSNLPLSLLSLYLSTNHSLYHSFSPPFFLSYSLLL
jgi:hypothetical protein